MPVFLSINWGKERPSETYEARIYPPSFRPFVAKALNEWPARLEKTPTQAILWV